ncbi:DUF397 domain-containing protein [Actinokineospora sp. PR83]|uniref:DUF397 domain-containing protein n=1 Tax=Actinokineospora sp. PR83 TaxID=2884908 RepID=UPI001F48B500|nr:DUF397 domain-containing protein [Actinokineospora sp. PR83]MCG8919900.1 DUF397 domain-containing protein [Actinokineospora sp. PR83]
MRADFRQSSFCSNGSCVQVGLLTDGRVALRDSKNPAVPAQVFPEQGWDLFRARVKSGALDPCPAV